MKFIIKTLREQKDLFKLIYAFNHSIASNVSLGRLTGFVDERAVRILMKKRRGVRCLSSVLEEKYDLSGNYYYDFQDPIERLALVESSALHQLMLYAGAAYFSESISHVISKSELNILKKTLGVDAYYFALKKAPFLVSHKPDIEISGSDKKGLLELILISGQKCLEICFSDLPPVAKKRVQLKFSRHIEFDFEKRYSEEIKKKTWNYLKMILTKEINRKLVPCFK